MSDIGGERHEPDQMLPEHPLVLLGGALGENTTGGGQLDRAVSQLCELQHAQFLGYWKQVVYFEGERTGDVGRATSPPTADDAKVSTKPLRRLGETRGRI
jgi:hypothetical protein